MSTLTPEIALFLRDSTLSLLKAEHPLTKRVIEAIPADRSGYRPDPISKTALELAWHIASAENRFLDGVASGEFNYAAVAMPETPMQISRWLSERFEDNCQRIAKLSGEQLTKVLDFRGMLKFPAIAFLQIGLNHTIHHRGQLSVYLRPMGAAVPTIYGESYAAAQERKSREAAQSS